MDFRTHRPQRGFGRSERSLAKIAEDLSRFLTKAQRSLTYDTLHLSGRQRETLASLLVEFAEDLAHDIGIWKSLEAYNRDFFGTPLPCVLPPDETMDADRFCRKFAFLRPNVKIVCRKIKDL
jgi:GNAT superfamily N-acetyltransferase